MGRVVVLGASTTDMNMRPALPAEGRADAPWRLLHRPPAARGPKIRPSAARRAGAEVVFLTAFGDDAFAGPIRRHDEAEGIDLRFAKTVPGAPSGVAMIFVADDGENLIGIAMGANAHLRPEDIDALPDDVFDPRGVLLASLEVPIETVVRAVERAHARGMTVVVNPAPGDRRLAELGALPRIDVLTPNESEAEVLTGKHLDDPAAAADALRAEGVKAVVITLGGDGCLVVDDDGRAPIPARKVEVIDTVGAGDAFSAALAVALSEGRSLRDAASWAVAAAAIAVTRPGAQGALPTRGAIDGLAARA